jgi:hypothetical protein
MVNVDSSESMPAAKVWTEHLHVPCQHKQIDLLLFQQSFDLRFLQKWTTTKLCYRATTGRLPTLITPDCISKSVKLAGLEHMSLIH